MPEIMPTCRLDGFLREFARSRKYVLAPLRGGMLDQTLRLIVWPKTFVLKVFRPTVNEQQIEHMHELMQFVSRSGVPVSRPIATAAIGGRVCAIYSFLPGICMSRYRGSSNQARAVGSALGRIHVALDRFSATAGAAAWSRPVRTSFSRDHVARQLSDIREKLKGHDTFVRREMTPIVDCYERMLSSKIWDARRLRHAEPEFCHGDFHGGNVLVDGSAATGVLDWDKAGWYSRCAEVGRALVTTCRYSPTQLAWARVGEFVKAYLHHRRPPRFE